MAPPSPWSNSAGSAASIGVADPVEHHVDCVDISGDVMRLFTHYGQDARVGEHKVDAAQDGHTVEGHIAWAEAMPSRRGNAGE